MQIKTAVSIGGGILIGVCIGMCVEEDQRIRLIKHVKEKIIYALTGDEWAPKVNYTKPHRTTYASCYGIPKEYESILIFNSKDEADQVLTKLKSHVAEYKYITVHEVAMLTGKAMDYTWDAYGWTDDQIELGCVDTTIGGMFKIFLSMPKVLKRR